MKIIAVVFCLMLNAGCSDNDDLTEEPPGPVHNENISIGSGNPELILAWKENTGYTVTIAGWGQKYIPVDEAIVCLEVFPVGVQSSKWYRAAYQEAEKQNDRLVCKARIITDSGSDFEVTDIYTVAENEDRLRLSRVVDVMKASGKDHAFNSYFMVRNEVQQAITGCEYFIPSLIYKDESNLSESSIGADFTHDWILAREERMGLPLAMFRNKSSEVSVALADYNLNPVTFKEEVGMDHLVNADMHFGSLGFYLASQSPALVYCFPGSEGEHTYADGGGSRERRWARRSHPVRVGVEHAYMLELQFKKEAAFPKALEEHWKATFNLYNPEVLEVDNEDVMNYSLEVLDHYWLKDNDAPGFPFSVHLPSGEVNEISYSMGFVGMQIPCAYYLYRKGLETNNSIYTDKGEQILDFWAENSSAPNGMPRIWWDISPWNFFRNHNDLRNMQGGLEAMILAWSHAEKHFPGSKTNWLDYCRRSADWMVSRQYADGSWDKAFDNGGTSIDSGKLLTSNLIRFLTYMYIVTKEECYKTAAVKAGEFCYREIHEPYKYVGSVIDNPYVKDRESGQKIIEAFLCLYDLTEDEKWLEGASQAAYYTVTYMYAWNIPAAGGNNLMAWDSKKTTVGITIISTGHSGADCGLSYNSFEYLRLYVLTGDEYFLHIARLLEKNTKQTMDYDGTLGYAYRGLQTEALRLVTRWGDGVNLWLPWVTASALDPLFKIRDAYGDMDIEERLTWLDEEYLSLDEEIELDYAVKAQNTFEKPVEFTKKYPISSAEPEEDNTYLSYNLVVGDILDKKLYLAFDVLDYALLGAPGAPLKQALIDAGIEKDIVGGYDSSTMQPVFSIIAKNANSTDKEKFLETIQNVLKHQVKDGVDRKALLAGISASEFRYREADFGQFPKGLLYGIQCLDSWLYDDRQPFMHVEALDTYRFLREQVETGYFEALIDKYLIHNPHASVVVIEPERGLNAKRDEALAEKLAAYKESLNKD